MVSATRNTESVTTSNVITDKLADTLDAKKPLVELVGPKFLALVMGNDHKDAAR